MNKFDFGCKNHTSLRTKLSFSPVLSIFFTKKSISTLTQNSEAASFLSPVIFSIDLLLRQKPVEGDQLQ